MEKKGRKGDRKEGSEKGRKRERREEVWKERGSKKGKKNHFISQTLPNFEDQPSGQLRNVFLESRFFTQVQLYKQHQDHCGFFARSKLFSVL